MIAKKNLSALKDEEYTMNKTAEQYTHYFPYVIYSVSVYQKISILILNIILRENMFVKHSSSY